MRRLNKKGFEMSFAWIFSIIVGAIILFLAIYMAIKFVGIGEYKISTETSDKLAIILQPLETSVEEAGAMTVELTGETKIFNRCYFDDVFGDDRISLSYKSLGDRWSKESAAISIKNKYIFSDEVEGKTIYIFVKPFEMPFKISDLIFVYSKRYCFINPVDSIKEEIEGIGLGNSTNMIVVDSKAECEAEDVKVCFSGTGSCDILVRCEDEECETGTVRRDSKTVYFVKSLIYGAIFSSNEEYECNVKRLISRLSQLSKLYQKKSSYISARGCSTGLEAELLSLSKTAGSLKSSADLLFAKNLADTIKSKNKNLVCKLF